MSDQPSTLARRLRGARRRRFVGRDGELELFRAGLEIPAGPDWAVLWIHGPGGVGKTALLGVLEEDAETAGVPAWRLDLRAVELSPAGFWSALAPLLGATTPRRRSPHPDGACCCSTPTSPRPASTAWIREQFVPGLGEDTLVVIAGREPPATRLARGPRLARAPAHRCRCATSRRAMRAPCSPPRASREDLHDRVLELTHGHPLALSLLVDVLAQREGAPPELGAAPDVVRRAARAVRRRRAQRAAIARRSRPARTRA